MGIGIGIGAGAGAGSGSGAACGTKSPCPKDSTGATGGPAGAWAGTSSEAERSARRERRTSGIGSAAAPGPPSGSPVSPSMTSSSGTSTTTLVPPKADGRNSIFSPCSEARRATTWKPRRMSSARASTSVRGGRLISSLAASYCSGSMPRPRSSISIASPRPTMAARTSTGVGGLEKVVAFSISSAITCATGPTARSDSHGWPSTSSMIRR